MTCPRCKRPTVPKFRKHQPGYVPGAVAPPGHVKAALADGTCITCYGFIHGTRDRRRGTVYIAGTSPDEFISSRGAGVDLEAERQWFDAYVSDRRARGIDPEGIPVEDLRKRHA